MLKAHSKFLEQLMLAGDLLVVAACWLVAYAVRFYVAGPALRHGDVPPVGDRKSTRLNSSHLA